MTVVVDASAISAMLLGEERGAAVRDRFGRHLRTRSELHVPALFEFELVSAFTKAYRRGDISQERVHSAIDLIDRMPLVAHSLDPYRHQAADIAMALQSRNVYDPSYIALAIHLGAELWTTDDALGRNAVGYGLDVVTFVESGGGP